jgi:hypothetical protein
MGGFIAAGVAERDGPNDYYMFVRAQAFLCMSGHDPAINLRSQF